MPGLGPQLDMGEKYGELGLRKSLEKVASEKQLPRDAVLCEWAWPQGWESSKMLSGLFALGSSFT